MICKKDIRALLTSNEVANDGHGPKQISKQGKRAYWENVAPKTTKTRIAPRIGLQE